MMNFLRCISLRVCSIIGDLRKMKYETQTLSQRPDGRAVGPDRAFAAPGQPPPPGPAPQDRFARGRQRSVLPCPRRMYLASTAPRPAPVEDRLQLLPMWDWDGTWQKLLDTLRPLARVQAGRAATPSAAALDS